MSVRSAKSNRASEICSLASQGKEVGARPMGFGGLKSANGVQRQFAEAKHTKFVLLRIHSLTVSERLKFSGTEWQYIASMILHGSTPYLQLIGHYDHISPSPIRLNWLPVRARVQ